MKGKQFAALCSFVGLTLMGAGYADGLAESARMDGLKAGSVADNQQSQMSNKPQMSSQAPFREQGTPLNEPCNQPPPPPQMKGCPPSVPAAYNMAAGVNLKDSYDVFGTASFIYWMASSDGFDVSQYPTNTAGAPTLYATGPQGNGNQTFHKPQFKPGFKLGLGLNTDFDDWTAYAEYTWFHHTTEQSHELDAGNSFYLAGPKVLVDPADGDYVTTYSIMGDSLNTKWHLGLDLLDFSLSRCYYMGKRVTLEPMVGLRAAWIEQSFHWDLGDLPGLPVGEDEANEIHMRTENKSWAVGPRVGLKSQWLLGSGFRVDAKAAASLLFTRYTEIEFENDVPSNPLQFIPSVFATPVTLHPASLDYEGHYDQLRPNAEIGLGFGWGTYCCDDSYHFDICATYDLQVFWSQSLLRSISDTVLNQPNGANPRDLYLQGLTLTARLDF